MMLIILVILVVTALGVAYWYKHSDEPGFDDWDSPRDWHIKP